jgi:fructokinase
MIRIGIDFGGTKIEAAALDRDGQFLARVRAATPRDYAASLATVRDLVAQAERQAGVAPGGKRFVGVATPGSISPKTGLIRNANSQWLNGRPFREDLNAALEAPVRMANDANCLALSEANDGAAVGAAVVFAAILGTGCGGGGLKRDRRRMGPHAAAVAERRRASGAAVLVRAARLPRTLYFRHRLRGRPRPRDRA